MLKRNSLRRSEWIFMGLGLIIMIAAALALFFNFSFFKNDVAETTDPFQGTYRQLAGAAPLETAAPAGVNPISATASGTPLTPSNPITVSTPAPTAASETHSNTVHAANANSDSELSDRQKVFLLFPASQATLTNTRSNKKGYPLKLRFEVEPKETPCKFELRLGEKIVLAKEFPSSPTGMYEISILVRQPGLYVWQVFTPGTQSEAREFVIKEP
jgi:hypothetical protein